MLKHASACKCIQMHAFAGNTNVNYNANFNSDVNVSVNVNADAYSFYTLTYKKENYHTKKPSDFRRLFTYYFLLKNHYFPAFRGQN